MKKIHLESRQLLKIKKNLIVGANSYLVKEFKIKQHLGKTHREV